MSFTRNALAVVCAASSPQVAAEPDMPGFVVETYAVFCEPVRISLDGDGVLYSGNGGCSGSNGGPAWVRRVGPGGSPVDNYGVSMITDPDSVLFDPSGFGSGEPGTVLVGGPGVFGILPDESIVTVLSSNGLVGNVSDLRFDSTGRLLILNLNPGRVAVSSSGEPVAELFRLPAVGLSLTVAPNDEIYTAAQDGVIRVHAADGSLLNDAFATGLSDPSPLTFGVGGVWGSDLYCMSGGTLRRYGSDGSPTIFGTGFGLFIHDIEFGVDGALYLSDNETQILRVSAVCPSDADDDGIIGIGDFLLVLAQWGPCPPQCLGDIDFDSVVGINDLLLVLANWGPCP